MDIEERLNNATGQLPKATVNIDREKVDKILGMHWESQSDEFVFKLQLNRVDKDIINATKCPTKRQLRSLVMSVYDPFGMLADLMVHGKVLIQDVWKTGIGWNDLIPDGLYERFKQWFSQLDNVKHFKLERCYSLHFLDPAVKIDLHVFVDASKTKCAPLKMLSVPRLELQAAVLGIRLKNLILVSHSVNVDSVTLWSDSRTVIAWIRSDHRQYKQFVAHRISEILETTGENDWRWIPSHLNAADKATKAPRNMKYTPGNIWTKGPEFLLTDERNWPSTALESNLDDSLERKKVVFTVQQELLFDMDRFSNYLRLKRTFGWILRFVKRLRHQNVPDACGELTANELRLAEVLLCKLAQNQAYSNEITDETALKVKCEELNKNLGANASSEINSSATTIDSINSETAKNLDSFNDDSIIDPTYDPDTDDVSDNETEFHVEGYDWENLDSSLEILKNKQSEYTELRREIDSLRRYIEELGEHLKASQESLAKETKAEIGLLAKKVGTQNAYLRQILQRGAQSTEAQGYTFPISSPEEIMALDLKISPENRQIYITKMKELLLQANISKPIKKVLGEEVILTHQIEGVSRKQALKVYASFFPALLEAISLVDSSLRFWVHHGGFLFLLGLLMGHAALPVR
ncbi:hypothetical protein ACLKA7_005101 [Drosophila subpalustris]